MGLYDIFYVCFFLSSWRYKNLANIVTIRWIVLILLCRRFLAPRVKKTEQTFIYTTNTHTHTHTRFFNTTAGVCGPHRTSIPAPRSREETLPLLVPSFLRACAAHCNAPCPYLATVEVLPRRPTSIHVHVPRYWTSHTFGTMLIRSLLKSYTCHVVQCRTHVMSYNVVQIFQTKMTYIFLYFKKMLWIFLRDDAQKSQDDFIGVI